MLKKTGSTCVTYLYLQWNKINTNENKMNEMKYNFQLSAILNSINIYLLVWLVSHPLFLLSKC